MAGATLKIIYRNQRAASTKVFATVQQELGQLGLKVEGVATPRCPSSGRCSAGRLRSRPTADALITKATDATTESEAAAD